jgi:hypothetical protein
MGKSNIAGIHPGAGPPESVSGLLLPIPNGTPANVHCRAGVSGDTAGVTSAGPTGKDGAGVSGEITVRVQCAFRAMTKTHGTNDRWMSWMGMMDDLGGALLLTLFGGFPPCTCPNGRRNNSVP